MRKIRKNRKTFFVYGSVILILASGVAFAYAIVHNLPDAGRITERAVVESTKIYDRTGKTLLYEIHGEEKRTVIPLEQIPVYVRQAAIAAEDINFYTHMGLDWRGIARAFYINLARGDITQGGSTITQQLVKNSILTSERTLSRKIKEAILAIVIERKYSKDEILGLYLNQIPYGSNAYGVAAAAQTYFGKPAEDLTLAESALIAALPKAPTYYSPYGSHKDELIKRRDWILDRMAEEKFISLEEADRAKKSEIAVLPPSHSIRAPHFVFFVKEYLNEKYGEEFVERGGLKVITTLDWPLQEEAEKLVREGAEYNEGLVKASNAALVSVDPKTGEILAMVGSRDYWEDPRPEGCRPGIDCKFDPHVNIATRSRQPGSAFKPFVYAAALKRGYSPETVLFDVPTEFNVNCNPDGTPGPSVQNPEDCYHPQNYDGKYRGPVSLRQAIAQSLNVPSVKLLYLAGINDSISTAKDMGISTLGNPERYGLTLVLGGAEVTLLEMASSFAVFAADGIRHPYNAIMRVENAQGVALEEKRDIAVPALDSEVARTMNDILSDNESRVPVFSSRSSLYFPNRQVAAKTGTTQDYRDAWVIGYTPSVVTGVWVGNNDNTPMNQEGLSVMVAGPIWHKFMEFALKEKPPEYFVNPEGRASEKLALRGGYRAGPAVKIDKISKKLATANTPPELVEERSFGEVKSILAFVKKADPEGEPPSNPFDDPQFKNWQIGIERWLAGNSLASALPPKEYDDLHTPEKRPRISLGSIPDLKNTGEITARVQGTFPLREVTVFVNDELRDSKTAPITSENISFSLGSTLSTGTYRIKITAYDAVGNKESLIQEIQVN